MAQTPANETNCWRNCNCQLNNKRYKQIHWHPSSVLHKIHVTNYCILSSLTIHRQSVGHLLTPYEYGQMWQVSSVFWLLLPPLAFTDLHLRLMLTKGPPALRKVDFSAGTVSEFPRAWESAGKEDISVGALSACPQAAETVDTVAVRVTERPRTWELRGDITSNVAMVEALSSPAQADIAVSSHCYCCCWIKLTCQHYFRLQQL